MEELTMQELQAQINGLTRELLQAQTLAATYRNQKYKLAAACGDLERKLETMEADNTRLKALLFDYIEAMGGTLEECGNGPA